MLVGLQNWEALSMCLPTQAWWNNKYRNLDFLGSPHMKALGNSITFHKTGRPAWSLCSHSKAKVLLFESIYGTSGCGVPVCWDGRQKRRGCSSTTLWVFAASLVALGKTQCYQKPFKVAWFLSLKLVLRSTVPIRIVRSPLFSTCKCCQLISLQTGDGISFSCNW